MQLSTLMERLQSYLLSSQLDSKMPADPEYIARCVELVYDFGDLSLERGFDPWQSVNFMEAVILSGICPWSKKMYELLVTCDVDGCTITTILQSSDKLAMQRQITAQGPKIDLAKTIRAVTAHMLVSKLRSSKKPPGGHFLGLAKIFLEFLVLLCFWLIFMPLKCDMCAEKEKKTRTKRPHHRG